MYVVILIILIIGRLLCIVDRALFEYGHYVRRKVGRDTATVLCAFSKLFRHRHFQWHCLDIITMSLSQFVRYV